MQQQQQQQQEWQMDITWYNIPGRHTLDAMPVVKGKETQISIEKRRTDGRASPFPRVRVMMTEQLG